MREYFGKYGVYVAAGFVVVFLATLAFIVIFRLRTSEQTSVATVQPTPTPQLTQAPIPTASSSDTFAQLSFSLQLSPTVAPIAMAGAWECTNFTASPLEGTAPLTVRFTATAKKPSAATSVLFDFVFGDDTEQTIEKVSSAGGKTTETQDISHTYTKSGNFNASVLIPDDNGQTTDQKQLCQVDVAVGGLLAKTPTNTPTRIPTAASSATDTPIPVPKLPESGIFIPTALSVVGGIAVILLGILL